MKSALPKVAHRILGVPIVTCVVEAARAAGVGRTVVVTGHGADEVEELLADADVAFARQEQRLGTGHAVMCALEITGDLTGPVVVLSGDTPLVRPETIARLIETREATGAACVLLSAVYPDPTGYGRIVRDGAGRVSAIVEHKDLAPGQLSITEGNSGIYCFDGAALSAHLHRLETSNAQAEYYLTDLVGLFVTEGLGVEALIADDVEESFGINSRVQLAEAARILQRRINERHMLEGVTMTDPALVWVGPHVTIGRDTVVEPMTFLAGETCVGSGCVLGPGARITDSMIGDRCVVDSSIVTGSTLADGMHVGPWADVRP